MKKSLGVCPYFGVDAGAGQLVLDDHDDDTEHADDECVIADPLAFLEQRFPPAKPIADVGPVLAHGQWRDTHSSAG